MRIEIIIGLFCILLCQYGTLADYEVVETDLPLEGARDNYNVYDAVEEVQSKNSDILENNDNQNVNLEMQTEAMNISESNQQSVTSEATEKSDQKETNEQLEEAKDQEMSQSFLAVGPTFENMAALIPANISIVHTTGISPKHVIGYVPIATPNGTPLVFPAGAVRIVNTPADDYLNVNEQGRSAQTQYKARKSTARRDQRRPYSTFNRLPQNYWMWRSPAIYNYPGYYNSGMIPAGNKKRRSGSQRRRSGNKKRRNGSKKSKKNSKSNQKKQRYYETQFYRNY